MKGYGIPRAPDIENPDVGDIHAYGLKSRAGGRARGYHKNKARKAAARRIFKRAARREGRGLCVAGAE